jgi:VWFA-related protein
MQSKTTRTGICAAVLAVAMVGCAHAARLPEVRPTPNAQQEPPGSKATTPAQASPPTFAKGPAAASQPPSGSQPPALQQQPQPQQQPPQAGSQTTKPDPQAAGTQKPTFKVLIELVTTDVIVRDSKGQFVPDVTKDEFEVYEDGVKQDVASFELNRGGRHTSLVAPPPAAAEEGILLPVSRPPGDVAGRILIFFIDDLHLEFRNTARIRKLLQDMQKTLIHDGDMFAIQTTGPSSVAVDLTYDKKRFAESITRISGSELKPSEIINGPEGEEGPSEVRYRAHVAFSTVNDLLLTLDQVRNRRKALIYVSDGYDFNPFENARAGIDPTGANVFLKRDTGADPNQGTNTDPFSNASGKEFADADLVHELADLTRTANRANVTMYTIDPRGLVGGSDLDEQVDPTEWQDYIHKSQDSLRVLAEQTGGIAVINQNDFSKALQKIDADTSDYYMLGYYSKNPDPTKRYRAIEVKVKRPNMNVTARKGYQLKRPPKAGTPPPPPAG